MHERGHDRRWSELVELARRQAGVVSTAQAVALGIPTTSLARMVRRLGLERPARGTLLFPGADPDALATRAWVGLAAIGPPAWVSGLAALALAGAVRAPPVLDVVVPHDRRPRSTADRRVRRVTVTPDRVTTIVGVPTLTPAVALREVAWLASHADALAATAAAVQSGTALPSAVDAAARSRARGATQLRRIAGQLAATGAQSILAHEVTTLLRQAGYATRSEVPVRRLDGRRAVVDVGIVGTRVAVEADGVTWHDRPGRRRRDRERDNQLAATGLVVLHVDWHRLRRRPEAFLAEVAAAVRRDRRHQRR